MKELTENLSDPNLAYEKLVELRHRSRRNNLLIYCITKQPNEIWKKFKEKVMEVIKDNLNIEIIIDIDGCHRMGKRKDNRPYRIIFKFNSLKDKQKINCHARNLKNTRIYIYKDFCDDTMALRKSLRDKVLEF